MLTLGNSIPILAKYCGTGKSPDDPTVKDDINQAIERLMNKPKNWSYTVRPISLCAPQGVLTLPREVAKLIKARVNGRYAQVQSTWYEYLSNGPGFHESGWHDCLEPMIDRGWACTQYDIPVDYPMYVTVIGDCTEDKGAKLLVRGLDETGREVHYGANFGELIPIRGNADEMFISENLFSAITAIEKPVTQGYCYVSAILPVPGIRYFLGSIHPDETHPHYRRYGIEGIPRCKCRGPGDLFVPPVPHRIDALARLMYVPAVHPSDVLLIQNLAALKMMLKAMRFEDAENMDEATKYEATAVRFMGEMTEMLENDETSIDVDPEAFGAGRTERIM